MTRTANTFKALREKNEKALIPYIMAGDPDLETTAELLEKLPAAGADVIELGMPFTDPMADGPAIQEAALRSLKKGTTTGDILDLARGFRENNKTTPLVLMGYFNPVFKYGVDKFCQDAAGAGVDGLLIVDIPPEEGNELWPMAKAAGLDIIRMITPTSRKTRLQTVLAGTSGFLYYVSITGITGTASANPEKIQKHLEEIRQHTQLPIAVGFGINTPEDAAVMAGFTDAVVVGSALVKDLKQNGVQSCLERVKALKKGVLKAPAA